MKRTHFILYVRDQARSTRFYSTVLDLQPRLDVPGMTEFELPGGSILGLMPESGIKRLIGRTLPDPSGAAGIPRCELYLIVGEADSCLQKAIDADARELSAVGERDWGHRAGYCLDPDGHVLAFAEDIDKA